MAQCRIPIGRGLEIEYCIAGVGESEKDNLISRWKPIKKGDKTGFQIEIYKKNDKEPQLIGKLALPFCNKGGGFGKLVQMINNPKVNLNQHQHMSSKGFETIMVYDDSRWYGISASVVDTKKQEEEELDYKISSKVIEPEKKIELVQRQRLEDRLNINKTDSLRVAPFKLENGTYHIHTLYNIKATNDYVADFKKGINLHSKLKYNEGEISIEKNTFSCYFKYDTSEAADTRYLKSKNGRHLWVMRKPGQIWTLCPIKKTTEYDMQDTKFLITELRGIGDVSQIPVAIRKARLKMTKSNPNANYILGVADVSKGVY